MKDAHDGPDPLPEHRAKVVERAFKDAEVIFWLMEASGFIDGISSQLEEREERQRALQLANAIHNYVHPKVFR